MPEAPKSYFYKEKLTVFAGLSLVICLVAVILYCAPATNPSYVNGILFRGNSQTRIKEMLAEQELKTIFVSLPARVIFEALAKPQKDQEFYRQGLLKPETVKFKTTDGVELEGWYFPGTGQDTVLVCYNGYGKRVPVIAGYIKMLREAGLSVLLFDYRGFNETKIINTPQTAAIDAQAAYDYLIKVKGVSPEHLILLGREIGAWVCLKLAAAHGCRALILENPWTTVKGFLDGYELSGPVKMVPAFLFGDDCLNNVHLVSDRHPPILVILDHEFGTDTPGFITGISPPKTFLYVAGIDNTSLFCPNLAVSGARYIEKVKSLLADQLSNESTVLPEDWQARYHEAVSQDQRTTEAAAAEAAKKIAP